MKIITYLSAALVAACTFSDVMAAETWNMPTPYPITSFHTVNIEKFAADVHKATNGKLKINVHSAGALFKHPDIKNAVRSGQVPIGEFSLIAIVQ